MSVNDELTKNPILAKQTMVNAIKYASSGDMAVGEVIKVVETGDNYQLLDSGVSNDRPNEDSTVIHLIGGSGGLYLFTLPSGTTSSLPTSVLNDLSSAKNETDRLKEIKPAATVQTLAAAIVLAESGNLGVGGVVSVVDTGNLAFYELKDAGSSGARPAESASVIHVETDGLYLSLLSIDGTGSFAFNTWSAA